MRQSFAIPLLALVSFAGAAAAQQKPIPEPEFDEVFLALAEDSSALLALEPQEAIFKTKGGLLSFSSSVTNEFRGGKSPVRFKAGPPLAFVVSVNTQLLGRVDPNSILALYRLKSEKSKRSLTLVKGSQLSGNVSTTTTEFEVPFEARKVTDRTFIVSPLQRLAPGEYAFSMKGDVKFFLFGIDSL